MAEGAATPAVFRTPQSAPRLEYSLDRDTVVRRQAVPSSPIVRPCVCLQGVLSTNATLQGDVCNIMGFCGFPQVRA